MPSGKVADASREFATLSVVPNVELEEAKAWFKDRHGNGRLLIFVHGYNVSFGYAVYSLAQIALDSEMDVAPVLFSWPSSGLMSGYMYDRESANYSRDALEEVLRLAAAQPEVTEITVLAHSMGSWLAIEALRQYAIRDGKLDPKIRNVILAAPDLDLDVFLRQMDQIHEPRPHFTFLVARNDVALTASRFLAGGSRVGALDPTTEPVKSLLENACGVTVLDLTNMSSSDQLRHSTFAESPEVVRMLGEAVINGNTVLRSRNDPGAVVIDLAKSAIGDVMQKVDTAIHPDGPSFTACPGDISRSPLATVSQAPSPVQ